MAIRVASKDMLPSEEAIEQARLQTRQQMDKMKSLRDMIDDPLPTLEDEPKRKGKYRTENKTLVTIRLDNDVVAQLRTGGSGWQTRANSLLKWALGEVAAGRYTP